MCIKVTTESFIINAKRIHGEKYDYSQVIYTKAKLPVVIKCIEHDKEFSITPNEHLNGAGCSICGYKNRIDKLKRTRAINYSKRFFEKIKTFENRYDYSRVPEIHSSKDRIKIICPIHGIFKQKSLKHYSGNGCKKCAGRRNVEKFLNDCRKMHGDKYDYSYETNFSQSKIIVVCPIHGNFTICPSKHKNGQGCKKCGLNTSKVENEWLDCLNISIEQRGIVLKTKNSWIKADGYDPLTNTVYEFYGDFFHGNPNKYGKDVYNKKLHKTFGECYAETLKREQSILSSGYNLITMWEEDFEKQKNKQIICQN